jgi:hypothetical protein
VAGGLAAALSAWLLAASPAEPAEPAEPAPLAGRTSTDSASAAIAATDAGAALEEATLGERATFRQVLVGGLVYPPRRLTWVLFTGGGRARLDRFCQFGPRTPAVGVSLSGRENDERLWGPPVVARYAGVKERAASRYRLERVLGAEGECEATPARLHLSCRPQTVSVLPAGAALIVGRRSPRDEIPPFRWQPAAGERVPALRCEILEDGEPPGWPFHALWPGWPLVFATPTRGAPGIEWAHENSDMVVQTGAFRWMPAPR